MELFDLAVKIGLYAGTAAFIGLALLIPLYLSQSRDVRRLREWAELAPDRGTAEFQAAEAAGLAPAAAIAPTSAEAAALPKPAAPPAPAAQPAPAPAPVTAAERVTRERPAAARITTDRPVLVYADPWWRRFLRRPDPRYLVAMVAGVLALGVGGALLAARVADEDEGGRGGGGSGVDPSEVEVTVLNGTAVTGLAAAVGDDVKTGGFDVVNTGNTVTPFERTVVMYERGHEDEAEAVAKQLGVERVEVVDPETRDLAGGADVVVNAGEDRVDLD